MTEGELEVLRVKLQIEAIYVLIRGLYTGLANISPTSAQGYRHQLERLRQKHSKIALKNVRPEYSDLVASEYQAILNDLLSYIESGIRI